MTTIAADPVRLGAESRRNLVLLTVCQAVGQAGNVIMLSVTALSVISFFPHRELATLPATLQHLGVMLFVFPAAAIMMRRGRGFGFRVGSVFGMAGAALCALGLYTAGCCSVMPSPPCRCIASRPSSWCRAPTGRAPSRG